MNFKKWLSLGIGVVVGVIIAARLLFAAAAGPTGNANIGALNPTWVAAGTQQPSTIASGDLATGESATTGKIFFGANGSQTLDFGVTTASVFTLTGGILAAPQGSYKSYQSGSTTATVSNSAANFFPFAGVATAQATNEGAVSSTIPNIATIKNLKCVLTVANGTVTVAGGTNYVIALDQNLVAGTLTCTIASGASSCTDTTHTVTTAIGDQLDYLITPSGTPTALIPHCSAETDL